MLDPNSTLIAHSAIVGSSTVIYPGAIISSDELSLISIGERCTLYRGCVLEAREHGQILIGEEVEVGPGGATVRGAGSAEVTVLGDMVRASGNCELTGACELGRGAQILGPISARSVRLGGGLSGHR